MVVTIIPSMTLPLDLLPCTCRPLVNGHVQLDIPGVSLSCEHYAVPCYERHCDISYGDTHLSSNAVIDLCTESLTVTVNDSDTGIEVWREVFTQNRSVQFTLMNFSPTLYVFISQSRYSMIISVSIKCYLSIQCVEP